MKPKQVLIIESRSPADHYESRQEADALIRILQLQGIEAKHFEVLDEKYLKKAIKYAAREHITYVHISAHGDENGFELSNEKFIDWKTFDKIAWPHLKNTCLCFSGCSVAKGIHKLFDYHKTFCDVIVAPNRVIDWAEGLIPFAAFYHMATKSNVPPQNDVKVMNKIVGRKTFELFKAKDTSTTTVL